MKESEKTVGFIDIHSHIIPAVDDGSKSLQMSLDMIETAYYDGIRTIVATPHFHPGKAKCSASKIRQNYELLKDNVKTLYPDMEILLGREVYCDYGAIEALEDVEDGDELLTMFDSGYVLIEFSPGVEYSTMLNHVRRVVMLGYTPIIAHIERYRCVVEKSSRAEEIKNQGAVIQINASSVTGNGGFMLHSFVKKMIKHGIVDVIATDAHDTDIRAPHLSEAYLYVKKKYGADRARSLFMDRPYEIINEEEGDL